MIKIKWKIYGWLFFFIFSIIMCEWKKRKKYDKEDDAENNINKRDEEKNIKSLIQCLSNTKNIFFLI